MKNIAIAVVLLVTMPLSASAQKLTERAVLTTICANVQTIPKAVRAESGAMVVESAGAEWARIELTRDGKYCSDPLPPLVYSVSFIRKGYEMTTYTNVQRRPESNIVELDDVPMHRWTQIRDLYTRSSRGAFQPSQTWDSYRIQI